MAVFSLVLGALSIAAFLFVTRANRDLLEPIAATPEGRVVYANAVRRTLVTIAAFDLPLLALVAGASYALATLSLRPLSALRMREERFVADAAHELNTPLAAIATIAQAASPPDEASRSALQSISTTAISASELVADLLTLVRQPNIDPRAREPVALGPLAHEVVAAYHATNGVAITLDVADGAIVYGEERRVRQLLLNLLTNANRHARAAVRVTVGVHEHSAFLEVEDDGMGVAPEDRARIFERFFTSRPHGEGHGLGLAICRWIADAHGAEITVAGARFRTTFPRLRA